MENRKRFIKDSIYDLRLKYTTLALESAEYPLRPAERHRKLRKSLLSSTEGYLRSEEDLFMPTADSLWPTERTFSGQQRVLLDRSIKRPSGPQRSILTYKVRRGEIQPRPTFLRFFIQAKRLSDSLTVLSCQQRVLSGRSRSMQAGRCPIKST